MNRLKFLANICFSTGTLLALSLLHPGTGSAQTPVTVTNPETQPVAVKEVRVPGTTPFQATFDMQMLEKTSGGMAPNHVFVPVGKLVVIEN